MHRVMRQPNWRACHRQLTKSFIVRPLHERLSSARPYTVKSNVRSDTPKRLAGFGALCLVFVAGVTIGQGRADVPEAKGLSKVCYADRNGMLAVRSSVKLSHGYQVLTHTLAGC